MSQPQRELLFRVTRDDLKITQFRAGGPGGQNQNKRDTACRIEHPDSGAVVESRTHRTFDANRKAAFLKLPNHPKFKIWHAKMVNHFLGKPSIEQVVEEMMDPKNLRVEVKDSKGRWIQQTGE